MRWFVAAAPPPEVRAELEARLAGLRERFEARWSDPARWHVTLAFLGERPEAELASMAGSMSAVAARFPRLELRLEGAGTFGGPRPRVLWVGLGGEAAGAEALAAALRAALGVPAEGELHLTVARARSDPRSLAAAREALAGVRTGAFAVEELALVESAGGEHRTRATCRLGGSVEALRGG